MTSLKGVVITKGEALRLFGIKPGALKLLEQEASVAHKQQRLGYTTAEFRRLRVALDRIME